MLFDCCFLVHRSLRTAARAALCMWHWHRYCPECPGCTLGKFLFQYSVWCQRAQMCPSHSAGSVMWHILYFFDQTLWLTLWLLFEGSVYFFGKPGDINNAWIGYVQVWQWQLLDVASSTHILSVLLSAVGMTRTAPVLALVWWLVKNHSHAGAYLVFTSYGYYSTIWGRHLFHTKPLDCAVSKSEGR